MNKCWVAEFDGTIQCAPDDLQKEISLDDSKEKLALLIGEENILAAEKSSRPVAEACGLPTGVVNAFNITDEGVEILFAGIVGPTSFFKLRDCEDDALRLDTVDEVKRFLESASADVKTLPVSSLVGRPFRIYGPDDKITLEHMPSRFNIMTDKSGKTILFVSFG